MKDLADEKGTNLRNNLLTQVDAVFSRINEKSFATKDRYHEAMKRFSGFLADEFRLQNIKNISDKHVTAYTDYLVHEGKNASTIKTELAGIRFFQARSGSKNRLPTNKSLHVEKRKFGRTNRAWMQNEFVGAFNLAVSMKRYDVAYGMAVSYYFGLRIDEVAKMKLEHLETALKNGELYVKGKGGKVRYVPIDIDRQRNLLNRILVMSKERYLKPTEFVFSNNIKHGVKRQADSFQNWIYNHAHKFIDENREQKSKTGFKPNSKTITWHGLRYSYAQWIKRYYTDNGYKNVDKRVIQNLGHERKNMTSQYLAEIKKSSHE